MAVLSAVCTSAGPLLTDTNLGRSLWCVLYALRYLLVSRLQMWRCNAFDTDVVSCTKVMKQLQATKANSSIGMCACHSQVLQAGHAEV